MMTETQPVYEQRLSINEVDPAAHRAVLGMEQYARGGELEPALLDLVKIRASQINGCAFCLDMHNREARGRGEDQQRLDVLAGWHEAPGLFSARERAALTLAEEVALIADHGVRDDVWDQVTSNFSEPEIVRLLMAVATINVWNRLAVSTHQPPEGASPAATAAAPSGTRRRERAGATDFAGNARDIV